MCEACALVHHALNHGLHIGHQAHENTCNGHALPFFAKRCTVHIGACGHGTTRAAMPGSIFCASGMWGFLDWVGLTHHDVEFSDFCHLDTQESKNITVNALVR